MNSPSSRTADQTIPNVIFCSLLVLIESIQLLVPLVLVFSFIPIPTAPIIHEMFPRYFEQFKPERESLFYHCWVVFVFLGEGGLLYALRGQLSSPLLSKKLMTYFIMESIWLFLTLFAAFKIFVYGQPPWAFHLLYTVLGASVLSKLFWKELNTAVKAGYGYVTSNTVTVTRLTDIFFPLLVAAIIFVPDLKAVLARMWIGDNLIHWDTTLMGQAWAWLKGEVLNIDVYTHYGLGMPIFVTLIAKTLGIFSYTGILSILIWATILYFVLCYFFLRSWLKSAALSMAGTLLAVKWQVFHEGSYPFVFTYPYSTVCRNLFDIAGLFLLLAHIRRGNFYWLVSASALVGLALFYISDTGVYLFLAFLFYLTWLVAQAVVTKANWKQALFNAVACVGMTLLSTLCWFLIFQGGHTFSKEFWANMSERVEFFLAGHGDEPIYASLVGGDYLVSLVGFLIPLVYTGTLAAVVALIVLRKMHRSQIMAAIVCVYGMGLYHYYVYRSAGTAYDTVCIPYALVLCWIASQIGTLLTTRHRRVWEGALVALSIFALATTHSFLSYPNVFNRSPNPIVDPAVKWPNKNLPFYFTNEPRSLNPMLKLPVNSLGETDEGLKIETDFKSDQELKDYFDKEFDYTKDAQMIDSLTAADEPVPLLSSFETRILMQADRRPFFYYYPIIDSSPRRMRIFPFSKLWTVHSLQKTMDQFEKEKPPYVFMEKIFLTRQVPKIYEYIYPDFLYILSYLDKNYKPYKYGEYLVALKRI